MKSLRTSLTCAFALALLAVVSAQTPVLDVRLGLWEVTTVSQMGGDMPAMDLGQMPPAQRAQIEAAMKAAMAQHTDTSQECITKEDLDSASFMMQEDDDSMKCKQAFTANTKTRLESNVTCTGERSATGHLRLDAATPTTMKAAMDMTSTEGGKTMKMSVNMTGKWLKADCGSVK